MPLSFLLQYNFEGVQHKLHAPMASYFQDQSMNIYGAASGQSLFGSMTQD